jgi:PAS domain S-box-containing protein
MKAIEFSFGEDSFNTYFPFYILIDSSLCIKSFGKSLEKVCPQLSKGQKILDHFSIQIPELKSLTFEEISKHSNKLTTLESTNGKLTILGQIEIRDNFILFLGSPKLTSINDILNNNLTASDFAINDPVITLLDVLNKQDNTTKELLESLITIENQSNQLKEDQEELDKLSLVAKINEDGVVFTDAYGIISWCNDSFLKLTGFSKEEVIGKTPLEVGKSEFTNLDDIKKMASCFFKGKPFDVEIIHRKKDGTHFWTRTKGQSVLDKNGNVLQYFATIEDISKEKQAVTKLIDSENNLKFLVLNSQSGILLEDENGIILLANKQFCTIVNYDCEPEDLIGRDINTIIEELKHLFKNIPEGTKNLKNVIKKREPVYNELIELADGRILERSFIPIYTDGIYKGNFKSYSDVTIQKKHEDRLKKQQEKYSNIISNMNLGLNEVDLNDVILYVNKSFCDISGYSSEELIGQTAANILLSEESKKTLNAKNDTRKEGVSDSYEVIAINKQKEKRNWLISGAPSYDENGNVKGSIGIHLDITAQKVQEQQLKLLSLIAEKNINAVVITNEKCEIEWANPSFSEMTGYSFEELIGRKIGGQLRGPETNIETVNYMRDCIDAGKSFSSEIINYSKTGEKYWVRIQVQPIFNEAGEVLKFFAIEENINDKRILEEQKENLIDSLAKSNEELEEYAHIVSHDLKSPLRSIHSLISWIKEDDKELNNQTLQYLNLIENKVEKMDYLIEVILTYAKIDRVDVELEKVNLQDVAENIINIIHIPNHITVNIKKRLPILKAHRFRMQQLFQNLITNAISSINKPVGNIEIDFTVNTKEYIFTIKDNGTGISTENQELIFNKFQSFSKNDKSTGLGLSIVKKIIDTYNGQIWIESELEKGTTFYIKIPK